MVKKSSSTAEKKSEPKTPTMVQKTASDPSQSKSAVPEKLQNLFGISVTRSDSGTPSTPKTPTLQRVASSGSGPGSPQPPCSPATLEHQKRSVSVQLAKLKVKAMEDKDKMDKAVQDQEFLLAAELKNSLAVTQKEMEKLEKVLDRCDPDELKNIIVESTPVRKRPAEVAATSCQTPTQVSTGGTPSAVKVKKLTPKKQKEREDKAKAREEEKKAREEKKAALEKEKEEKKLEREREKKEREAQKEKERKEKEALKEKEKADKEKERLEKEAQRLKEKAEKEAQKEQQKKDKEQERLRQLEEKERFKKEKQEEKEKQEKLEKAKQVRRTHSLAFTNYILKYVWN